MTDSAVCGPDQHMPGPELSVLIELTVWTLRRCLQSQTEGEGESGWQRVRGKKLRWMKGRAKL